jgi:poly-gamma-glutamate synthesis protein (capsule biosynthesis protein)
MKKLQMLAVGDIVLGPNADFYFELTAGVLKQADVVVGHLEVPHTDREEHSIKLGRRPETLASLARAGFHVMTLAGNHLMDAGAAGVEGSIAGLRRYGLVPVGAGINLAEARRAAVVERDGVRFGFLNYNCVGPVKTWAAEHKPGCAYIGVVVQRQGAEDPGSMFSPEVLLTNLSEPDIRTKCVPITLEWMKEDVTVLRRMCDVVVVVFHKGIVHTPIRLAQYEREVAHAAVVAGVDVVFSHHSHILHGIEVYKGKTIYHGLCNFATYVPVSAFQHQEMPPNWAEERIKRFGFVPDPEYPTYPFHPEARYTIIAKCEVSGGNITRTGFLPCIVNKQGRPVIVKRENGGEEVLNYMIRITEGADLNGKYAWEGDEVVIK